MPWKVGGRRRLTCHRPCVHAKQKCILIKNPSLICFCCSIFRMRPLRFGSISGDASTQRNPRRAKLFTPFMTRIISLTSWTMIMWLGINCLIFWTLSWKSWVDYSINRIISYVGKKNWHPCNVRHSNHSSFSRLIRTGAFGNEWLVYYLDTTQFLHLFRILRKNGVFIQFCSLRRRGYLFCHLLLP